MRSALLGIALLSIPAVGHAEESPPTRMRSPAMVATGISSAVVGAGLLATSGGLMILLQPPPCAPMVPNCHSQSTDMGIVTLAALTMIAGVASVIVAIPLISIGARQVPARRTGVWLAPGAIAGRF